MEDCLFCKIIQKEIPSHTVWENGDHLAFLDINPIQEGHTLIIPKNHHSYLFDMDDESYQQLLNQAKILAKKIKDTFQVPRVGMVVEGFAVDHVHVHLIPIKQAHQLDPNLAKPADQEELQRVAEKIQQD